MLNSIEGVYRRGRIELPEVPFRFEEEARVIVVFPEQSEQRVQHLAERGIDERHALNLRDRLATFADDWDNPEMDVYDDYRLP